MKKTLLLFLVSINFVSALINSAYAQVSGDSVVCSGYIYNYSVVIPGAVTYNWTPPSGWYGLTGQNSSIITVTCNVNDGPVCVEGFDINSNSLGTFCISTSFGNGGAQGWDLQPNPITGCLDPPFDFTPTIVPNGTGGGMCPSGCGNGTMHPNLCYCLYTDVWPTGNFVSVIDGVTSVNSQGMGIGNLYAYYVDTTNGVVAPDAIQITGGCGSATVNNSTDFSYMAPIMPQLSHVGGNCIGDTVVISDASGAQFNYWAFAWGGYLITGPNDYPAYFVVDSTYSELYFDGFDLNGCHTYFIWFANFVYCIPPVAGFASADSFLCPGSCTNFSDLTVNGSYLQWSFPGANPDSSTDFNPQNICYSNPGTYDVTLIAGNGTGSDTLTLSNYITVFPFPPPVSIVQHADTLIADAGLSTYQWYYNSSLISGATDFYYIATANGDYNVVCQDANGCEVEAVIYNVMTEIVSASLEDAIELFPNPAYDKLFIQLPHNNKNQIKAISIFNVFGELMIKKLPTEGKNNADVIIDISELPAGIYIVELTGLENKLRKKFVKD